jgi:hypothetical protein
MNRSTILAVALCFAAASNVVAQGPPDVVWEAPNPNSLANNMLGVGWSPGTGARIALGSSDRWVRTRDATNGALVYSVLQPINSGGANQTVYSIDGTYLAVHNRSGGLGYRVHRAADGVFLGNLTATLGSDGLIRFAPDAQLLGAVGGDGTLSSWRISDFTVVHTVGSGYDRVTTVFNFSPNGAYQSAASGGASRSSAVPTARSSASCPAVPSSPSAPAACASPLGLRARTRRPSGVSPTAP